MIPKDMRAVVYRGPNDLRLETVPVPQTRAGELLVRVAVCGVCPTDIKKIQYGTARPPRIFGHETAGTVVRVGAKLKGFKPGDRVALHHHVPCLECHVCKHHAFAQCAQYKRTGITAGFEPAGGGYAEYVRVLPFVLPGVVKIPKQNSFAEGAMLEPVNTVLKGVKRLNLLAGDKVLVVGQGPIGLMFTRLLVLVGFEVIASDLFDSRLRLARQLGAKWAYRPTGSPQSTVHGPQSTVHGRQSTIPGGKSLAEMVERVTRGRGLDAAVMAVPSLSAMREAQQLLRGGGQLLLFSNTKRGDNAELDLASVCMDEKDIIGSYSSDFLLQKEVARLVFSRGIDMRRLITHEFPLEQTDEAVRLAANPTETSLKVIVRQCDSLTDC